MKPSRLFFTAILIPIDYAALVFAAIFTYTIRFQVLREFRPTVTHIPFQEYLNTIIIVAAAWILLFALNGMYRIGRRRLMNELNKVFFGCAAGFVAILLYLVFTQELYTSRFILLGAFVSAIVFISVGRLIVRALDRLALKYGLGVTQLMLIGKPESREALRSEFENKKSLGFRVISEHNHITPETLKEAESLRKKGKLDGIILTDPTMNRDESVKAINLAEDLHVRFFYSADLFTAATTNIAIHTLAAQPIIEIKKTQLDGWGRVYKRTFDIIGSFLLLVLTLPITIPVFLAVFFETGRPIFFRNKRVGEHEKLFNTLKFRSMHQKFSIGEQFSEQKKALEYEKQLIKERSEKKGPLYKIKEDPRLTRVGRFLRRWSLDELPQLWNVLCGDMALVGPRPHQPREVEQYARHHRHVLEIKPGITGLAQISGRSDLDFEEEIRLDTYYVENWSLALDLFILLKTPFVVFLRKGAY